MAEKPATFSLGSNPQEIKIGSAVKREELYGKQTKTVEKDGPLEKIILSPTGEAFLPSEFRTQRVDSEGSLTGKAEACGEDGTPLPVVASTFKEARPLNAADWAELATMKTKDFMPVSCSLPEGVYKTQYSFRDTTQLQDAFLIVRAAQSFLLVGEIREIPLKGKGETYDFFESEDAATEEDEEMSFDSL